ncbi:MAG: DUF885 domain-containing protein [Alphaproteobacteria bacterium]|nr:DUF885 domain-containing protein [Alphaproteobacteria bacterium]
MTLWSRRTVTSLLGATALTVPALGKPRRVAGGAASGADAKFVSISKKWLEAYLRLQPTSATDIGDHRYDGEIDDMSPAGRALALKTYKNLLAELTALDRSKLSRDNQVDALLLINRLKREIWDEEVMQSWAWNPQAYSSLTGGPLYSLMAREFAPLPARLRSATLRMEKIPRVFEQMRAGLVIDRVPPVYATTVQKQNAGVKSIIDSMVLPHADALSGAERERLEKAAATAKAAAAEQQEWIDKTLVPGARGDFRIGAARFDEKLQFTLNSNLTRAEVRRRAEAAVVTCRAQMYEVSRKALAGHAGAPPMPDAPTPEQQQAVISAALELAYAVKPARDKVVAESESALARATGFVRDRNLITLPDAPVAVVLMPEFARGVSVAYCDAAGPLEKGGKTFYTVSPIPDDWTDKQVDSFLREYNSLGIQDIAVHEAMPGHYVQIWHANQCPSMIRAVLSSGSFVEGWACYAEAMMVENGFLADQPLYHLVQLKVLLRTITNAILDQAIHVDGISRDAAMRLMTETAFQQESEAAGKWVRASLSSTQLSTYFVGVSEHNEMRAEAQKRAGGGFDLKAYHDKALSYGSAPVRYVRALMFDEPIT